jgi:23S rRNA (adenine-N6)-dimethyltransferase
VPAQATRWGWHRLDSRWARQIVDRAQVAPGDLVLDIGAGDGALTGLLLATGATVVAFELHPERAATLRRRFAGERLTVVQADAADLRLPRRPFRVVANPPFAITTAIMRRLLHPASRLQRADLVLPHWATVRWAAGRGVGGISSRQTFHLEVGMRVPARAFRPPPPAPTAVLTVSRRPDARSPRRR